MSVYSEHLIAALLPITALTYPTGGDLDADLTRQVVTIGRVLGVDLGCVPSDPGLVWFTRTYGTVTEMGSRAAVHLLPDGRTGIGLGTGRGIIESRGDGLALIQYIDPDRYTAAYRLPNIAYGGLI